MKYKALCFTALVCCVLLLFCTAVLAAPNPEDPPAQDEDISVQEPDSVRNVSPEPVPEIQRSGSGFPYDYQTMRELEEQGFTAAEDGTIYPIDIPTRAEILENGLPVNANGETYGPDHLRGEHCTEDVDLNPDLTLAVTPDGAVGYLRFSEDPGAQVSNPEEALAYMAYIKENPYCPNLYLEDGVTVIGKLHTSNCNCFRG